MNKCVISSLFVMISSIFSVLPVHAQWDMVGLDWRPRTINGVKPMPDGENFSRLSDDARSIQCCSFKTGECVEVLFDVNDARGARIAYIDGYIVSPDAKTILIETQRERIYRHSATSVYYLYNVKNKTLEPLSKGGPQECPKFSPDGTMVAFVRENNIFLVKLLYNNAESQITKDGEMNKIINGKQDWVYEEEFADTRSEGNSAFDFSADNEMIAWTRFDESEVKTFSFPWYKGMKPERTDCTLYPGSFEYKYPKAGEKNSTVSVLTYDIKSRVTRKMEVPLAEDDYIPRIQFSNNRDALMVVTLNRHQDRMDVYKVNPRSTQAQLVLRETNAKYVDEKTYETLDFSNSQFVMLSDRDGFRHMYLYTIDGTLVKQLTSGEFEVLECYGADDTGKVFYFLSNEGSPLEKYVYKVDVSGKRTKLSTHKGNNKAVFSKGCNYYLNCYSDINTPYVYSLCNNKGTEMKVVEDNSALKAKIASSSAASAELFSFSTPDGVSLNAWMVKPRNFDASKKYPVLMYQYSGPGSQEVLNAYSDGFLDGMVWEKRLADNKNIIVVCVDGRGTGGRGSEFLRSTYMKLGDLESHDQVESAIYLGNLPYVDKNRIGIWGWSFGGFNTLMSMCEGRGVFRCGIAVAPVTDWRYYDSVYTERYMRRPQENPSGYDCSPLHRCNNIKGDLLLIHGLADDNVHYQNTAELSEALVQQGYQFDMQVYTNRNHSIYGGNTRRHLFTRIENFIDAHLLK